MHYTSRLIFHICLLFTTFSHAKDHCNILTVHNQDEFDQAIAIINKGNSAIIKLKKGQYTIKKTIKATKPFEIHSKGAIIEGNYNLYTDEEAIKETGTHYIYNNHNQLTSFCLFVDNKDNVIPISESVDDKTGVNCIKDLIEGENATKKDADIRIPIANNLLHLRNKHFSNAFGYVDCGWSKIAFIVNQSDNNWFYCKTLTSTNVPNVNYDKTVYKKDIRYVIYNAELKEGRIFYDKDYVYIPKNINVAKCVNTGIYNNIKKDIMTFSDVVLKGVIFKNFNGISITLGINDKCEIEKCKFINTLGNTLNIKKTNNKQCKPVLINDCEFTNCAIASDNCITLGSDLCKHTCFYLTSNSIIRYKDEQIDYKNTSPSVFVNADAIISNNIIKNCVRSALFLWKGDIEVKNNILYNSDKFTNHSYRNLSNDFGIIYCNHLYQDGNKAKNDTINRIIIKENYISGAYAYAGDARGIMIDDGRGDVTCEFNTVLNTQLYSIDSREVPKFIGTSSIRNVYSNNIIDNRYRLEGGIDLNNDDLPIISNNILLMPVNNITKKVVIEMQDTILSSKTNMDHIVKKYRTSNMVYNKRVSNTKR